MIKKIGLRQAGYIYIAMSILTIFIQLLVIFRLIPYKWINGGRIATYEATLQTSINGIIIFTVLILIALIACGVINFKWNNFTKIIFTVLLWIVVAFACFGLIAQLLGTPFEKAVMSVICAISIIAGIRLAIEKR